MTMTTRIVVMKDGYIQQVGSPKQIYDFPNNIFVGGFIGTPPMNFLEGSVNSKGYFEVGEDTGVKIKVPDNKFALLKKLNYLNKPLVLGIRPEDVHDDDFEKYPESVIKMKVDVAELLGAETLIYSVIEGQNIVSKVSARVDIHMDDDIRLALDMNKCHFFDPETELRIKED
ncbi:MAG: TOBE domain-containing protein, partial [Bacilli bacterium]|nr:TOBE domain-containing protein [Bacilli bacterium]